MKCYLKRKRIFFIRIMMVILLFAVFDLLPFIPFTVSAEDSVQIDNRLSIVSLENRTLSIDKLLYMAFKDINYRAAFPSASLQTGFNMANDGESDGVIANNPDMELTYPNLVQVPVILDQAIISAYTRTGSQISINTWSDLSGLKVGILSNRVFIQNQVPYDAVVSVSDTNKLVLDGLLRGDYDVAVLTFRAHETYLLPDGIKLAGQLDSVSEYLYLNRSREYLVPEITDALNNMFSDGRAENILNDVVILDKDLPKTIIHIISTNTEQVRQQRFIKEIRGQFNNDSSIEWYAMEFSTARFNLDAGSRAHFAKLLREDCVSRNVAAIIVSGNDALEFVEEYYFQLFRNLPILFYSVSEEDTEILDRFEPYTTGITEHLSAYETVSAALSLFPDTKNIFVVNDYTTEGKKYKATIENQLKPFKDSINIEYNDNIGIRALINQINDMPADSMVLVGSYFLDGNRQYYSINESKRIFENIGSIPIFSLYSTGLGYNTIGGSIPDYKKNGEIIADMLKQIFNGVSVNDIPIINSAEFNQWIFDWNKMVQFEIPESLLPNNSRIENKPLSIWESDPRFAIILVVLLVMGIAASVGISVFLYLYNKQKEHLHTTRELLVKDEKIMEVKVRLETIINTAPVAYVMAIDGVVIEANEYMKKHLGVRIGDKSIKFYADTAQHDELINCITEENPFSSGVVRYKMADGSIRRLLTNITTVEYDHQTAHIYWAMDIEHDEIKNDQLRIMQQSLQTILDATPMSISLVDVETETLVYANYACYMLFEYDTSVDLYGKNVRMFCPEFQRNGTKSADGIKAIISADTPAKANIDCLTANGNIIEAQITSCVIDYKGRKTSLQILRDLAAEKEHERILLRTAEKEKEANQLKSRFLVNMSHEIRTPMNAIIGLTEIELRRELAKETKTVYKKINTSAKNLLNIINDILDLSKIEADKIELYYDEFEIADVISSAMLVASPRLDGKNVEFMLNASLDLPRFIIGDRTRLWQILKNFLDNSAKYTESGKIVLTINANEESSDDETICLTFIIEDTGIGIDDEQMKKVFMPYTQIYNEAQKKYTGTGLGMVISKQLCELMGGGVQIDSKLGKGTVIHMNIPFARSQNTETELEAVQTTELAGVNILAVDDDNLSLSIISRLLDSSGAKYELASSGEEAIETIIKRRGTSGEFDLILLDYMMDGLNGLETARQIQMSLSIAPKLLLVTAYQKALLRQELEKCNIEDVIEKPFIPMQFINRIRAVFEREAAADEEQEETYIKFRDAHILICEDYHVNQEVAVGMTSQFGVTSTVAENGRRGVELLNNDERFDLILMDLQMPVMDGYEATRMIRADSRFDDIPIISLTADAMKEVTEKCMEIGMNDYLSKPIDFDSLHKMLLKWLPESKRISGGMLSSPIDQANTVMARFGGNKGLYEKALSRFAEKLPAKWVSFEEAILNLENTKKYMHKIKGASGNLSENNIYDNAVLFDNSLHNNEPDEEAYNRLIDACNALKAKQSGYSKEINKEASIRAAGSPEEFKENLVNLKLALLEFDLKRSAEAVNVLKEKDWPEIDLTNLKKLYKLTEKYDYTGALDLLELMLELIPNGGHDYD